MFNEQTKEVMVTLDGEPLRMRDSVRPEAGRWGMVSQ